MKKTLALLIACSLMSMTPLGDDDKEDTNAMFKAAYLYTFTKLVDWPNEYKTGDFVIGVLGSSNLFGHLEKKYASKSVGSQPIKLKQYSSVSDISGRCHILFISEEKTNAVRQVLQQNENKTLIVTEKGGSLNRGAVINFVVKNNQLEYELSKTNAKKYELIIGSQLRDLALTVE